jgi:hypothetical protein
MTLPHSDRRPQLVLAVLALSLLVFQPGCDEAAPANESEQRIDAQKKRGESLKGEFGGLRPPSKALKTARRR